MKHKCNVQYRVMPIIATINQKAQFKQIHKEGPLNNVFLCRFLKWITYIISLKFGAVLECLIFNLKSFFFIISKTNVLNFLLVLNSIIYLAKGYLFNVIQNAKHKTTDYFIKWKNLFYLKAIILSGLV